MPSESRRLAAILFSDIVGYTALVAADEAKGAEVRDRHRRLVQTLVEQFHGQWVEETGDETLSIFPSSLDAVHCAFATTSDGVRIAYSAVGDGPPVVSVLGWFTHLERGYGSPKLSFWSPRMLERYRLIQYDGRGTGLSDKGLQDYSLEKKVRDLEAVVDASGLERFALYGISAGGATAIAYAVRVPTLVIHKRGDAIIPFEGGRELASLIPGARLLTLEGNNHAPDPGSTELIELADRLDEFLTAAD